MFTIQLLARLQRHMEEPLVTSREPALLTPDEYIKALDRIESLHLAVLTLEDAGFQQIATDVCGLITQQSDILAKRLAHLAVNSDSNYHAEYIWQALGKYAFQGKSVERLRDLGYYLAKLQPLPEVPTDEEDELPKPA